MEIKKKAAQINTGSLYGMVVCYLLALNMFNAILDTDEGSAARLRFKSVSPTLILIEHACRRLFMSYSKQFLRSFSLFISLIVFCGLQDALFISRFILVALNYICICN